LRIADKRAKLLTRTGLDWTKKYQAIAAALLKLPTQSATSMAGLCDPAGRHD
jgi:ATP-dependent DNA ligase